MAAGTYDIVIDQGSDFALKLDLSNADGAISLAGYSARAQMRPTPTSDTLSATFTCTILDAASGSMRIALTNGTTAGLTPGKYYYDVEIVSGGGAVTRLIQGIARVTPEVTR
jgi:hypothetical protein